MSLGVGRFIVRVVALKRRRKGAEEKFSDGWVGFVISAPTQPIN